MNNHRISKQEKRELTEKLRLARCAGSANPKLAAQLEALARDVGHLWHYHNKAYAAATRPLWDIMAAALHMAYVIGRADADYDAGRALESLDSPNQQICEND
jgi:hypothetical protein